MAGIKATSLSLQMLDADTAVDKTVVGFVTAEQIVAQLVPAGSTYQWQLRKPSASVWGAVALTGAAAPECAFTPDVPGAYTLILTSDGNTYQLTMGVDSELPAGSRRSFVVRPIADSLVATPVSGLVVYCSSTQGNVLAVKTTTGAVRTINTTAT